ncbi:hypothetical protein [Luteolibacter sp.]|uniref:hypothetical protein n=1 Tax=Luteolibacter sp. TaxID=1962973 RepID=UPI003265622B
MIVAGSLITLCAARSFDEPSLPAWNGSERAELEKSGWIPGAILLTEDPIPDEPKATAEPLNVELPSPEEIVDDLRRMTEVPEKFLPAYFAERPNTFLVDPQGLLSPSDYRDRLSFLNYHASDSSIDLYVYVIGGDQDIPSEVREEEMIERCFSDGRPAAIVYYYLGAPQRSVVYLSPSITGSISAPEQHRALESSVMQAFEKTNPSEQFARFLVQMSIRIYWMERKLAGDTVTADESPAMNPLPAAPVVADAKSAKLLWVKQLALRFAMPAAVLLGAFLTAFGFNHWLRLRARYRFPEFDVEPRLGGAHAAGVGAVISFASATLPPASQRDQVPDYLRRA